jgi:hypothetical protein
MSNLAFGNNRRMYFRKRRESETEDFQDPTSLPVSSTSDSEKHTPGGSSAPFFPPGNLTLSLHPERYFFCQVTY